VRCHLCGFHFKPDMHMCVIAATREIPYCAHGAAVCACCNTNGFLTPLCKRHALRFGIESNSNGWLIPPHNFMTSRPARDRGLFYHSIVLVEEVPRCYPYGVLLNPLALASFHAFSGAKGNHSRHRRHSKQDDASRLCMFPPRLMSCISASSLPIVPPDDRMRAQSLFRAGMTNLRISQKGLLSLRASLLIM
jgi:hypothetical protein